MRAACVLLAAWALVAVHAQLPVGVTDDPCKSHAPTPDVSLGCIWGPLGDALEVPKCTQDGKHGLAKRLVEGVESIDAAHKAIHVRAFLPAAGSTLPRLLDTRHPTGRDWQMTDCAFYFARVLAATACVPMDAARWLDAVEKP
jgi:hypothetical protein